MDKTAGVVIIGDEILSGKYADENACLLIGELRDLGVSLRRIAFIPDDVADIAETVSSLSARVDYLFTSGGVGPTHDDVTIAGIARGFGTRVIRHPDIEALLRQHYGADIDESRLRLAEVPEGAELVAGESSRWPVICFRNVYILPGVPALFRRKFQAIRERFRALPFFTARVYADADEASLARDLSAAVAAHPKVAFGSYPRVDESRYKVVITVESKDLAAVREAAAALAAALGSHVVDIERP